MSNNEKEIHVMVVEDDDAHAVLIERAMASWSDPVRITRMDNGQTAADHLDAIGQKDSDERRLPDIVLLDLKLPRLSGIDVLGRIKSDPVLRHIPVITFTSSKAPADVTAAYDAHANSYLVKPVGFELFRRTLKSVHEYWVERNTPSPVVSNP